MKYYENDELSSGVASRLAGIPRGIFILLMGNSDYPLLERLRNSERADFENVEKYGNQE